MYIDFHSHVLPNIDDGSDSVDTSLRMLRYAMEQGAQYVFATPHFYPKRMERESFFKKRAEAKTLVLQEMEKDPEAYPKLLLGAEFAYTTGVCNYPGLEEFCLENTRYLLLELPYDSWKDELFEEIYRIHVELGLKILLAHPDRFYRQIFKHAHMRDFMQLDCVLQINANSIADHSSRKNALKFFTYAAPCVFGSDMHDSLSSSQKITKAFAVVKKKFGEDMETKIQKASEAILADQNVEHINELWRESKGEVICF